MIACNDEIGGEILGCHDVEMIAVVQQKTFKGTPAPDSNNNDEDYDEPDYQMGGAEEVQEDSDYVPDPETDDSSEVSFRCEVETYSLREKVKKKLLVQLEKIKQNLLLLL
uniref:Alpha-amylase inhibitor 2 n=1 Tax=Lygus hesperus TaxID=30085 RepID=A0A0A9X0V0_LYGHE